MRRARTAERCNPPVNCDAAGLAMRSAVSIGGAGYRWAVTTRQEPPTERPGGARDPNAPLFRLAVDEGAGVALASASGDVAGGSADGVYSWVSQVSTVVAYHVLETGAVSSGRLAYELAALDGRSGAPSTYRSTPEWLRTFLDSAKRGEPAPTVEESPAPCGRMGPIGVWFRRDPQGLIEAAIAASRTTHVDAASIVLATAVAGAVAGACFAMQGRDLLLGASETASATWERLAADAYEFPGLERARSVPVRLGELVEIVELKPVDMVSALGDENGPRGLDRAYLALALGSARTADPIRMIEVGAMAGGSLVGAITGSIVGARAGLMRWPWRVPNENWFAEIGRRLMAHNSEVRDLPVAAAVEEGMLAGWSDGSVPGS